MSDSQVEDIKSKLNIVDVVGDYVQLKKVGANYKARCPFHQERTPSFHVTPARQIWHCFGCGLGGDVFAFLMQIESIDFREALEKLAERAGVELKQREFVPAEARRQEQDRKKILYELNNLATKYYHQVLLTAKAAEEARQYLQGRKFRPETIKEWLLGYSPDARSILYDFLKKKGYQDADIEASGLIIRADEGGYFDRFRDRIMFPIIDLAGRAVGFSARLLHKRENAGKYINSPESAIYSKSKVLFGLYHARSDIRKAEAAVVAEGQVDAVKSWQAGVRNVVASSGTAFTEHQLNLLSRLTSTLIFAFDADAAGLAASRRALDGAVAQGFEVRVIGNMQGRKDPDEVIDQDPQLWKKLVADSQHFLEFYFHRLFDILPSSEPAAKAKAVKEFFSLMSSTADPIVISEYIKRLSASLAIREQMLMNEFQRTRTIPKSQARQQAGIPAVKPTTQERMEQRYIGLVSQVPDATSDLAAHDPAEFTQELCRKIFLALREIRQSSDGINKEELLQQNPDFRTALELAEFTVADLDPDSRRTEFAHISLSLRKNFLVRQTQALASEIARAERGGEQEQKKHLALRYTALLQALQALELTPTIFHGSEKEEIF